MTHLHCDACLQRFPQRNPQGQIVSSEASRYFHLASSDGYDIPDVTVCGRDRGVFESSTGTFGLEVTEWDIEWHARRGKRPCPACWGSVGWKLRLAERAHAHGARPVA